MVRRMNVVTAAALGALAIGGAARAADTDTPPADQAATPRRPLMMALDKAGAAQTLDDMGINIQGHVEGSYTYSTSNPPADHITGRVFDSEHDELILNQIDLQVDRTLKPTDDAVLGYKDKFNVGFKMEWIYGKDAQLIHANGLFDHYNDDHSRNEEFDLTQAYLEFGVPVGNGLDIMVGKYITPIGYEVINPTGNDLYSHSYMFGFAIPFTHTGVQATYNFDENTYVSFGVNRGWDQSLEDNNGNDGLSYLGSVGYTYTPANAAPIKLILNGIAGPEQTDRKGNWRVLLDLVAKTTVGDQITLGANVDWAYEDDAAIDGNQAQWYGVALYAGYKINDMFTINTRGEWFNDKDGARGLGTNVYEVTAGVAIHPMPKSEIGSNLVIRPEVRYDYAQMGIFDGGTDHDQLTFGVDAIFTF